MTICYPSSERNIIILKMENVLFENIRLYFRSSVTQGCCKPFAGLLQCEQGICQPHVGSSEKGREGTGRAGEARDVPRGVDTRLSAARCCYHNTTGKVYNSQPVDHIPGKLNPDHNLRTYFSKIRFNIIIPSGFFLIISFPRESLY